MDIEDRMVTELQSTVNEMKWCKEEELSTLEHDMIVVYNTQRRFVEAVTGKHVKVEKWVVRLV